MRCFLWNFGKQLILIEGISFSIRAWRINIVFFFCVRLIGLTIFLYSYWYIENRFYIFKFFCTFRIFLLSILCLILSERLFLLFIGWEGLGISSFLLIAFYKNNKSIQNSIITILRNRVGDFLFFLLLGETILLSLKYSFLYKLRYKILFCLVLLAITKRALFFFSSWLLLAMAAPTPISSLVHSRTLVTAGLYLLMKFAIYLNSFQIFVFLIIFSLTTVFYRGFLTLFEIDSKKIIALSTIGHIRLIFFSIVLFCEILRYFHMLTHAFFKRTLFTIMGSLIHRNYSNQDYRTSSKNESYIVIILQLILFSLLGVVFFSGWFSKDLLFEFLAGSNYSSLLMLLFFMRLFFRILYSIKLLFLFRFNNFLLITFSQKKITFFVVLLLGLTALFFGKIFFWNYLVIIRISNLLTKNRIIIMISLILLMFFFLKKVSVFSQFFNTILFLDKLTLYPSKINQYSKLGNFYLEKNFLEVLFRKNIFYTLYKTMVTSQSVLIYRIVSLLVVLVIFI